MRQNDLAWEVRDYLKSHPKAAVVNLGCGLDNTGRSCDNGECRIYNLDFPGVIAVRNELLPAGEREENIGCDLNDTGWSQDITVSSRGYMLGYQSLNDPSVKGFYRLLAKIGDGMMKMQIVRIDFNENR